MRPRLLLALTFTVATLAAGIWYGLLRSERSAPVAAVVPLPQIGGDFRLTTHQGREVSAASFQGKWLLVYFGFTHCPVICPTTIARIGAALDRLGPLADDFQPLFISVDPARDTPAVLTEFLGAFDRRFLGLTGPPEQVAAAATAYRVYYGRASPAGPESISHTDLVYVMDPEARFVAYFAGHEDADHMAARLRGLLASRSNPDGLARRNKAGGPR